MGRNPARTPFSPQKLNEYPPSSYEYAAANHTRNRKGNLAEARLYSNAWTRIVEVYTEDVMRDEQVYWTSFNNSNQSYTQVIYAVFDVYIWRCERYTFRTDN